MLPSHGLVSSAFLLAHASRRRTFPSVADWAAAARELGSFIGAAVDLEAAATRLKELGLVVEEPGWQVGSELQMFGDIADRSSYVGIASVILHQAPPFWLRAAGTGDGVPREFIPTEDMRALAWMEPDLDRVLSAVASYLNRATSQSLSAAVGATAELVVLSALKQAGCRSLHVALVSDAYGYDIQVLEPRRRCLEVKGSSVGTRGSFYLSRNEYERSCHLQDWELVQVVFASEAFSAGEVRAAHVQGIYGLRSTDMHALVPKDRPEFRWAESAWLSPYPESWELWDLEVPSDFRAPGFASFGS